MQSTLLSILDSVSAALLVIQEDLVVYMNPTAIRLLGCAGENRAGLRWSQLVMSTNGGALEANGDAHIVQVIGRSGNPIRVQMTLSPIDWDGHPARMATLHEHFADPPLTLHGDSTYERYEIVQKLVPYNAFCALLHPDGSFTREWMTHSFTAMTGYDLEELGNTFSLYHPDDQVRASQHLDDVRHGKGGKYEYRIFTKSGEERWVSVERYPIWSEREGRVTHFYGVSQDITEYKRTTDALRRSEERYRIISELISDYAYSFSVQPDGSLLHEWITESFTRITGYTQQEIDGRGTYALFAPEEQARAAEHMREVLEGKSGSHEYRIITKSGETRWVNIIRYADWDADAGRVVRLYGVAQDITERRRAEDALRRSEERYRIISELISDYAYCFRINPDRTIENEWVTGSVDRITGYTQQERQAMDELALYAPEDQARAKLHLQHVIDGKQGAHEYCIIAKSGERRWVRIYRQPVWDQEQSRYTHFYGVTQDITERRLSEQAMRESEERYRIVAELISDYAFSYRVNPDRTITREWTTESFQRMTGFQLAEKDILGQLALYAPEEQERVRQHLDEVFDGQAGSHDYRIITKAGETRWLHVHRKPIWDEREGRVVRFYGVAQNITERKLAEQVMRESEEKYRLMAENVTDMISKHSLTGYYTYVSPSVVHLLGYEPNELIGHQPREFIHPDDIDDAIRIRAFLLQSSIDNQRITNTFRMRQKTGGYVWMESTTRTIRDPQTGESMEIIAVSRDVSERKQMEQAMLERERLEAALQKERELGEMKTNLMRTLSHEFRTPLSIIQISVDIFERYFDKVDRAQREERLNIIRGQVRRLTEMLDDIAFVVAGAIGHLRFQPIYTDLAPFIESTLKDISTATGQKHKINYHHSGDLSRVWIDQVLITRILNNLVSNALKYSAPGGEVSISARNESGHAVLEVSDHGIGIPSDDVDRIFEPFFRAANVGAIGGTGLGLNIVKECVALHGGRITVESHEHQGTTFTVMIPLSQIGG